MKDKDDRKTSRKRYYLIYQSNIRESLPQPSPRLEAGLPDMDSPIWRVQTRHPPGVLAVMP